MKIGCIGYANHTGLGNYISNFRKHLPLDSQLIVRHPDKGTFPIDIPYSHCDIVASEKDLNAYLDEHSPDVILIIETPFNNNFYKIIKERDIKIIYIPMIDCTSAESIQPFVQYMDVIINHTVYGHTLYEKIYKTKAKYVPYPIDTEYFHPDKIDEATYDFLHNQGTGGAGYRKATDQVFIAFRQLIGHRAKMLVNSQPYEHIHSQLFKDVKNVTVKIQDYPEAIEIYKGGKIYVAPSRREGLGLPILEAMACGLPVITTNAPPMNQWFEQDHLLVEVQREEYLSYGDIPMYTPNPYDLMQKMTYAIEHPKHMIRMGKANREIIEKNFSWRVLKNEYKTLLEKVMKDGSKTSSTSGKNSKEIDRTSESNACDISRA